MLLRATKCTEMRQWQLQSVPLPVHLGPEKHSGVQDSGFSWVGFSPTAVCCKLQRTLQFRLGQPEVLVTLCLISKPRWDPAASSFCAIQAMSGAPLLCLVPYFQKTHDCLKSRSVSPGSESWQCALLRLHPMACRTGTSLHWTLEKAQ